MRLRSFPRKLTGNEKAVLLWLVENAAVGDAAAYRGIAAEELKVVGGCDCGCASLDFQEDTHGSAMIADAVAEYPDGLKAGLILWGRDGVLTMLEVYEMDAVADRMPDVLCLRPYG